MCNARVAAYGNIETKGNFRRSFQCSYCGTRTRCEIAFTDGALCADGALRRASGTRRAGFELCGNADRVENHFRELRRIENVVHAANMLNAVTEEISYGTIYKAEDLTTNPDSLAALIAEISGGQISANREWLNACLGLRKVNAHIQGGAWTLTDWQVDVVRAVVSPESWSVYEELGYVTPPFVG
jgi:hypothetical protein